MRLRSTATRYWHLGIGFALFVAFAYYLFDYSLQAKSYSEAQIARDLMWLDAWALCFLALIFLIWQTVPGFRYRSLLLITGLSIYGAVAVGLILDGTFFGYYAFGGDQAFRQAMVLKFMEVSLWGDYFFKDLPTFYPPLYYLMLALYGWLGSVEAYKMLKIGSLLIYLLGPGLLYYAWSRVVSPFQAFLASLGVFVVCAFDKVIPFGSPPAFIGNSLFIPWWLYFVEQVRPKRRNVRFLVTGGVAGALIFMVYPYAFFIGGILLVLRTLLSLRRSVRGWLRSANLVSAWSIVGLSALLSAVYWGPALVSLFVYGSKPADQEWYHLGHPGVHFEFLQLSWVGLLSLAGLAYALRKHAAPLYRSLLMLAGATLLFYLVGSCLGSIDRPVNLPKAKEFLLFLSGPMAGLAAAAVIRAARRSRLRRIAVPVLAALLLLVFMNQLGGFARSGAVKKARSERVPQYNLDSTRVASYRGSVFLAANGILPAFHPVYMFIVTNQHYAHPASRYLQRYKFLYLLQEVENPRLFHTALTRNIFDRTEFFWPILKNDRFEIPLLLNNYPNRLHPVVLEYHRSAIDDRTLFFRENDDHLYRVLKPGLSRSEAISVNSVGSRSDSLISMLRWQLIAESLDSVGRQTAARLLHADWSAWRNLMADREPHRFDRQLELIACRATEVGDSTYVLQAYWVNSDQTVDYKLFLHLYGLSGSGTYHNYDFRPRHRTTTWRKGDIILCCRSFPTPTEDCNFILGFFDRDTRRGSAFNGHLQQD